MLRYSRAGASRQAQTAVLPDYLKTPMLTAHLWEEADFLLAFPPASRLANCLSGRVRMKTNAYYWNWQKWSAT